MKRVIGIVSEGPTDQMAIRTVIDRLTGEKNIYRYIQPEQDARGEFGNGWKGVYRWCENNAELIPALFSQIMPRFDALIIHMDGDVSRKEKEVHCKCGSTECDHKDKTSPLDCIHVRNDHRPMEQYHFAEKRISWHKSPWTQKERISIPEVHASIV
jgi:hypothetical protein